MPLSRARLLCFLNFVKKTAPCRELLLPWFTQTKQHRDRVALRIEHLKVLENEAIARAGDDPAELKRYTEIQARRKALEHQIGASPV